MNKILLTSLMMLSFLFTTPAKAIPATLAIAAVKGGTLYDCPIVPIGQVMSHYMNDVTWTAERLDSGIIQVVAVGKNKQKSHGETIMQAFVFALNNEEFMPTAMRTLYGDGTPISEWLSGDQASDELYNMCSNMTGTLPQL